jgi:hypothetical protein
MNFHLANSFHRTNYVCKSRDRRICIVLLHMKLEPKIKTSHVLVCYSPSQIHLRQACFHFYVIFSSISSVWQPLCCDTQADAVSLCSYHHTHTPLRPLLLNCALKITLSEKNVTSSHLFTKQSRRLSMLLIQNSTKQVLLFNIHVHMFWVRTYFIFV